jgi:hypothetical protein
MRKFIFISSTLLASVVRAETSGNEKIHTFANDIMEVVTHTKEFPGDGHFQLTTTESDLVMGVAGVDNAIGNFLAEEKGYQKGGNIDCPEKDSLNLTLLKNDFEDRHYRIGAVGVQVFDNFKPMQQRVAYNSRPYENLIKDNNKSSSSSYLWSNMTKRISGFSVDGDIEDNTKKISDLLKKEGLTVTQGSIVAELAYNKLLSKPADWNEILKSSGSHLSFDEKVALIGRLGERLSADYNYDRSASGSGGYIPIDMLLKNITLPESGGVCRDIAMAQAQMLKAMGVKESYTVGYATIGGGHATVLAVDPNDKNRIIKMNYYDMSVDDGKKGAMVLAQDDAMPSTGIHYRVYDSEGKPVASVPTEIGKILREVTGQDKKTADFMNSASLYKVEFGKDRINGSLFTGFTSTGEKIFGAAIHGKYESTYIDAKGGITGFNVTAEKSRYDMSQSGAYLYGQGIAKYPVYEGKFGKLNAEAGVKMELLMVGVDTVSKSTGIKTNEDSADTIMSFHSKISYELPLNDKHKVGVSAIIDGREDKSIVADESSKRPQYDSTTFISKYEYLHTPDIKTTVEMATSIHKYGTNYTFKGSFEDKSNKLSVMGNVASGRAPSFFPGQQNAVGVAYERVSKDGWNFQLEYQKDFTTGAHSIRGNAKKSF